MTDPGRRVPCHVCGKWTVDSTGRWRCEARDCPNEPRWPVWPWLLVAALAAAFWVWLVVAVLAR